MYITKFFLLHLQLQSDHITKLPLLTNQANTACLTLQLTDVAEKMLSRHMYMQCMCESYVFKRTPQSVIVLLLNPYPKLTH